MWNMKKYRIVVGVWMLLLSSASCMDDTGRYGQDNRNYRITASIEDANVASRVADKNNRTSFTKNDEIFIGWSGSASYKYLCSGTDNVFVPNASDANRELWTGLLNASSTKEVYAWYGTMSSTLPAVGTNISIPPDQTSDSKMLSAICMAAHQSASSTTNTLDFTFHHLTARLFISVDVVDDIVMQEDVMGATARLNRIYTAGNVATDTSSKEYLLNVPTDKAGTGSIRMNRSWSDQEAFHLDFECLLPPQILGEEQNVTIILANGKEYDCHVSADLTLAAGQKTILTAELKASESSTFQPKLTTIPNATSAFSGNRLFCAIKDNSTDEFSYHIYDLQPDGSWGEGVLVYEDEAGTTPFPTNQYKSILKKSPAIDISGDYVVVSADTGNNNNSTFFIKKSKTTGKWYCANGQIQGHGYSVCISNDFLVSGNHVNSGSAYNHAYIYPIDEDGNLGAVQDSPAGIGAYKCSIYGNILATNTGVYEYDESDGGWKKLFNTAYGKTQRVATDGKRVIAQDGSSISDVRIYNVETHLEEAWDGAKARAAQSRPIGIYGNYALAGTTTAINICYRDPGTGKWSIINPDGGFLEMMKHWDPSITLTEISGENLVIKGTRAMIVSSGSSFFIENIDKMVEDYMANPY